jgi:hypothetical protein
VPPFLFVSELSSSCPSLSLSGSLPSSSSSDENIVTSLSQLSSNTWKISASSTVLCKARDVGSIIVTIFFILPGFGYSSACSPELQGFSQGLYWVTN